MDEAMVARSLTPPTCTACARLGGAVGESRRRSVERWLDGVAGRSADERLHHAVAGLAAALDVQRASLLLRVGPRALRVAASSDTRALGDLLVDLERYPELAPVLEQGRPVLVPDITAASELAPFAELLAHRGVVSLAAVPITIADVGGLLRVSSTARRLAAADLAVLELAAHRLEHLAATMPPPADETAGWIALTLRVADMVLELTPDGRVLHGHEPSPPRLEIRAGELIGSTLEQLLGEDHLAAARTRLVEALDGQLGEPAPMLLHLAGRVWVQAWGVPVGGPTPRLRVALQRPRSVTEPLARSEAFRGAPVALLLCDPGGVVRAANPAAEELLGGPSPVGRRLTEVVEAAEAAAPELSDRRAPTVLAVSLPLAPHDGWLVPLLDLRQHEAARQRELRLREVLRTQQDRLDALPERLSALEAVKGRFLAASAHELRTPLTVLDSYLEALLGDLSEGLSTEQLEFLGIVREAVGRLRRLVLDLVDLAALDTGSLHLEIGRVEPAAVVAAALHEIAPRACDAGIELLNDLPVECPAVRADRARVHQVLLNLLDNAVKFSTSGGRVAIRLDTEGDTVRLTVADTGPGIAPEHHQAVFEELLRLPAGDGLPRPGAGLGLAVSRRIATSLGGRLTLDSAPGAGARFTLHVPRWPESDDAARS